MTNVEGRRPEGAPERSRKAGEGAASASMVRLQSAFPFSARWRSSHDCCAVGAENQQYVANRARTPSAR